MSTDPVLPHSKEAETAILGAILVGAAKSDGTLQSLEPDDFFLPFHKTVFRHLKRLYSLGMPTNDLVLLHDSLEHSNDLEKAGGRAFIGSLTDGMARVSNLAHYAEIVKRKAQARSAIQLLQSNMDRLSEVDADVPSIFQEISTHSALICVKYGQKDLDLFRTASDLALEPSATEFVVKPYLVAGAVTDLVAKIKAGKTTYALGEFVRKALAKRPVVYLTEQPSASFRVAVSRAGLLGTQNLLILPFNAVAGMEWSKIARMAAEKCQQTSARLLVVDTVSHFAGLEGDSENDAGAALACMKPLHQVAAAGIAVLTIRHERKSGGDIGDAGRGSSAFGGAADTLLSLRRLEGHARPTLRKIECISRFDGLPPEAIYEYNDGKFEYRGTESEISEREAESAIWESAPDSEETAKELPALCEGGEIARTTAQRVVKRLVAEGKLTRIGKGKRGDPFRFFSTKSVSAQTPDIYGQKETNRECLPTTPA